MKFLIIAPRFHTNLYYRVKALQDAGHKLKVVVLYQGKSEFYENIDLQVLKLSLFSRLISKILKLIKKNYLKTAFELRIEAPNNELKNIFKNYKPDVVLLKAYQNLLAIKSLRIAKIYKTKVLMLTQTPYNHIKGSKFLFQLNIKLFHYLKVYAYITPVKINYDVFKASGIKNVFYLPFVFPVKKKVIETNIDKIRIISVGKFVKRKDQLLLLKAFNVLKNKYNIELDLYGEKADEEYYNSICSFIEENNLYKQVKIYLNIPYDRIIGNYRKYQIFILPSYSEPAAYSPVEAIANGLAVICSNENGTKCYISENENGFIFEAKNEQDLTQKMEELVSNKQKLLQMQKKALSLAIKEHNLENYNDEILNIIKKDRL